MVYLGIVVSFISTLIFFLKDPYEERTFYKRKFKPASLGKLFLCLGLLFTLLTTYLSDKKSEDQYVLTKGIDTTTKTILNNVVTGLDTILTNYRSKSANIIDSLSIKTNRILDTIVPIAKEARNEQQFASHDIQKDFTTFVILTNRKLPPHFRFSQTAIKSTRYNDYFSLASPKDNIGGKDTVVFAETEYQSRPFLFYGELLQYVFFKELVNINTLARPGGPGNPFPVTNNAYRFSESDSIPLSRYSEAIATNRFSTTPREIYFIEDGFVRLPKGTRCSFEYDRPSPSGDPRKYKVILQKPAFFSVEIGIVPALATGARNTALLIEKLGISPEEVDEFNKWSTYSFEITLLAKFNKRNIASYQTKEYIKWISEMLDKIEAKYNDDTK